MKVFYLTFGQRSPFRNGWVEIIARSESEARDCAFEALGDKWAFMYSEEKFTDRERSFFPTGKIGMSLSVE